MGRESGRNRDHTTNLKREGTVSIQTKSEFLRVQIPQKISLRKEGESV